MDRPIDVDGIANRRGHRGRHRPRQHFDIDGFHITQRHRILVGGLEHHLIRGLPHRITSWRPTESADILGRIPRKIRVGIQGLEWPSDGRHRHVVSIWIGSGHGKGEGLALQNAGVCGDLDHRRCIRTGLHVDLHVADDLPDQAPLARHPSPFPNPKGHVVLTGLLGGIPDHCAREGFHVEFPTRSIHFIGLDKAFDRQTIKPRTGHEVVAQRVAVGVICGRVVLPPLGDAGIFDGGRQQQGAVVLPGLGVDDELGRDAKRHVDRARNVEHTAIAVGILHHQGVDARPGIRVHPLVQVQANVAIEQFSDGVPCAIDRAVDARQAVLAGRVAFVAPQQGQPGPVRHHRSLGVRGDGHLVRRALHMPVGDLPRTVVCGMGLEGHQHGETEKKGREPHGHRKVNARPPMKLACGAKIPRTHGPDRTAAAPSSALPSQHGESQARAHWTDLG